MNLFTIIVTTAVMSMAFDQTPITTEARHLRKTDGPDHFKAASTDGFVPTFPGNSPGIGHKKGNANVERFQDDFNPTEGRRLQKTKAQGYFQTGSTGGFAPTSPGNSPGIGHKKGNANAQGFKDEFKSTQGRRLQKTNAQNYFKAGSTDGFAPTSPGNSPGIGHRKGNANEQGLKGDFEPKEERRLQKAASQNYFKAGSTDDFAPTSPGNSPGMGHKKADSFNPTTPGHSPGIGHAVKNDEPKA